jgi:undecaprenyl-diphosphatase
MKHKYKLSQSFLISVTDCSHSNRIFSAENTSLGYVMTLKRITEVDTALFFWFNRFSESSNCKMIKAVSKTGDGYLYLVIAFVMFLIDNEHATLFLYTALMAYALEVPIYLILKQMFKRERPSACLCNFTAHITPSDKFSLPSGHTAAAFLMATIIASFFPSLALISFTWATLVGLSRILLGVHFPLDVVLGAILGSTLATLSLFALA